MDTVPGNEDRRFAPIDLTTAYNRNLVELDTQDGSERLVANKHLLLTGKHELWGVPFVLGPHNENANVIVLKEDPVTIKFPQPLHDRQLVFVHAADFKENAAAEDGIIRPMSGTPRLGETVCEYKLHYDDNSTVVFPIRRRYQISEFQVKWGENSFEAVKHIKPRTMQANSDLPRGVSPSIPWGQSQLRTSFQGFGGVMHHWLFALTNPYPEKNLTELTMQPIDGTALIFGITRSDLSTLPFKWEARKKVRYQSANGTLLNPYGNSPNIRIDLGEVIAISPVLHYNHTAWLNNANPPLPQTTLNEWIIEYTAHPEAHLILEDGPVRAIELRKLEALPEFEPLEPATRRVTLRIVDSKSGSTIAAKLHVHGKSGEYIAPVNGHRLPNPHWFEDYGAEHVQGHHFSAYVPGVAEYKLPLGEIYVEVTKGFETRPVRQRFTVTDSTDSIVIELDRVLPWRQRGWVTADTHVHFLSPQTALLEGEAEGVNVINLLTSQWGEMFSNIGDFDGKTTIGSTENGGSGEYLVRVGTENRQHILGHISLLGYEGSMILPLCTGGPDESPLGDALEATVTQWARQCREQNGLAVLPHLPNPRAEGAAAIVLGEIDAIEMCSFENKGIDPYSLSDWYRYLNCGYHAPAVGGTDKMSQSTAVGTIRTYALIKDVPFTYDAWMNAVRQGVTFATYGPLLEFQINGCEMGSIIHLPASGGTLDVVWEVSTVTVPVTKIELVCNGELREVLTVDSTKGYYAGHWSVPVKESCWVALRIRGMDAEHGEIIAAHSSAATIIVDGKKCFDANDAVTILEQIEGSTAYVKSLATKADDRAYKHLLMTLTAAHRALHNRMHQHGVMHLHTPADDHHREHPGHGHNHSGGHGHRH
ncbi:CehA/McbA family metallohydrolase [Paenibacillus foliorum]|uniref:CehA/McbA family metallohydrolase n=1 Tax=Paenibacillus foliorum TaxID=2654974 RepID=UPI001C121863|nr:CehA/McbA family metallohydrolase [Paenibacillus foliorum]